ncbi:MAG: hypothetical protein H7211_17200 [Aquabacterium sp.]|nr:hypothetical protein [Ferruginibacter sp.]
MDIAPSVCAFIISLIALPSIEKGIKSKHYIIGFIAMLIMGFTIYQASENTDISNAIVKGKDSLINLSNDLLKKIETDSTNNASFQKFDRDTFGIDRSGNKALIYNYNVYKKNIYNFLIQLKEMNQKIIFINFQKIKILLSCFLRLEYG